MADKIADFLVDNGTDYDQIFFSTMASQVDHNGTPVSEELDILVGHNHDERYYTETEINNKLASKANTSHTHDYLPLSGGRMSGDISMNMGKMLCWLKNGKAQGRIYSTDGQQLFLAASNEGAYFVHLGVHDSMWALDPDSGDSNNQLALGTPNHRWGQLYSFVGSINTSDRNEKKDIAELEEKFKVFFRKLKPVSYRFINGTSGRTHTGFIAQDVEEAMSEAGLCDTDFAGFCKDPKMKHVQKTTTVTVYNPETGKEEPVEMTYTEDEPVEGEFVYGLRYEEFIALNTAMIQDLTEKLEQQKSVIADLKASIANLKDAIADLQGKTAAFTQQK